MDKFKNIDNKSGLLIGGGIFAGIFSSLCCIGPLVLTLLGVSGAATLSKLDVLRVPMIIMVVTLFTIAGWVLYRKRKICEPGSICADPKKYKRMVITYWIGLVIAVVGLSSPQWVAFLFG